MSKQGSMLAEKVDDVNGKPEPTKQEKQEARRLEMFGRVLRHYTPDRLKEALESARDAGDEKAEALIEKQIVASKRLDWERRVAASKRAQEACERSGTPAQLEEEKKRMAEYLANEPPKP